MSDLQFVTQEQYFREPHFFFNPENKRVFGVTIEGFLKRYDETYKLSKAHLSFQNFFYQEVKIEKRTVADSILREFFCRTAYDFSDSSTFKPFLENVNQLTPSELKEEFCIFLSDYLCYLSEMLSPQESSGSECSSDNDLNSSSDSTSSSESSSEDDQLDEMIQKASDQLGQLLKSGDE